MYITKSKDQWDIIALNIYGNEKYATFLQQNNYNLLDYFEFDSNIQINTPKLTEDTEFINMPDWRK